MVEIGSGAAREQKNPDDSSRVKARMRRGPIRTESLIPVQIKIPLNETIPIYISKACIKDQSTKSARDV